MRSREAVTPSGLLLMSTLAWSGLVLPERLDSDVAASQFSISQYCLGSDEDMTDGFCFHFHHAC